MKVLHSILLALGAIAAQGCVHLADPSERQVCFEERDAQSGREFHELGRVLRTYFTDSGEWCDFQGTFWPHPIPVRPSSLNRWCDLISPEFKGADIARTDG